MSLPPEQHPPRPWLARFARAGERLGPLITLLVLTAAFALGEESFRTVSNIKNLGYQSATIAIVAIGETIVIISAGIDLSVGKLAVLCSIICALVLQLDLPLAHAIALAVVVGLSVGWLNGALTYAAKMPSFVVTLGMMGICQGTALLLAKGEVVSDLPQSFTRLGYEEPAGIPLSVWVMLVAAAAMFLILTRTRLGRWAYALGGNPEAARLAGIPIGTCQRAVFALSGLAAGIAGVLMVARAGVGNPTGGLNYELNAIAAVVIGGTSLMGGEGNVGGTFAGALIMGVLANGLDHLQGETVPKRIDTGVAVVTKENMDDPRIKKLLNPLGK